MDVAIYLDNQPDCGAIEIDNEAVDRMLAAKVVAVELSTAQQFPVWQFWLKRIGLKVPMLDKNQLAPSVLRRCGF